jgi:hypothetical protein
MSSKVEIREKELNGLSVIFANWIGAKSAVANDWLNGIKTYYNIELSDRETLHLFTLIMCMLIDLTISRLSDLIESKEKVILEKNIIQDGALRADSRFVTRKSPSRIAALQ